MGILSGFLPFIVFALLSLAEGPVLALTVGAAVSAALMVRNAVRGQSLKILEAGTFILFGALALYAGLAGKDPSIISVRFVVDLGLLAIVLISMALRRPFTLQYARETVAKEHWHSERFLRTNYIITAGWALAFLAMATVEGAMTLVPGFPKSIGTVVIVFALAGGIWFTKRVAATSHAAASEGHIAR